MPDRPSDHVPLPPHLFEILVTLAAGPTHGYRIIQEVAERTDGHVQLSTSTLYGGLRRLLREGLAAEGGDVVDEDSAGPPRRYYRITDLGVRVAALETDRLRQSAARAARALSRTTAAE
jgi:PadR family transcriptional regulator PadR